MNNPDMFSLLTDDNTFRTTFNSLKNAQIFARKAEMELDTCFAGNFSDPKWVAYNDEFKIWYDQNLFDLSGKYSFVKHYKK